MNIRPLELLTKEELIELVKHERDDTQNLRNNFLDEINRKNSTIQGLIDRSNLPYLLKSGEVHFWDREGNNNIETLCSGAAVLIYANDLMQLIARSNECEGWKLVPVEPTYEMLKEIHINEHFTRVAMEARYKAMLAAAPTIKNCLTAQPTDSEVLGLLIEMRRELQACQAVINLAGFNTPSSASAALAAINKADIVIKAMRGEE